MKQDKNQLYKEFEKEVWLYLDKDLPDERMKYWEIKISEYPELDNYLEEYLETSRIYEQSNKSGFDDDKFNMMIDKAITQNTLPYKIQNYISNLFSTETEFAFGKIAFASALIVGAIVISLISNRPNPVVNITESFNTDILDWDADFVDNQIDKVGTLLRVASDEDFRKYYKYKMKSESVEKNLNLINRDIKSLKEELNSKEL